MAQCKLTPREFIGNAFSPQIGAVCSTIAESVCQKNNLSFIELLQPFCNLNTEGHFKDPQGTTVTVKSLRLSVQDINAQPPEPSVARKMLNDSVSSEPCERSTVVTIGNVDLDIPVCVPWFEAWREMFLAVQFPSDHEFTKHFLACMIVVASGDENPLEKIQQMATQLHQSVPGKLPKWFNNNALRYYVLIHDAAQDDKAKTEAVFTEMKNLYDPNNCFLLQMNSRPPGQPEDNAHLPDPWSQFLVKHTDFNASSDHSSSPRTPADMGGVAAMPSQVTTEPDKSSNAGTPIAPQSAGLLSPDITDKLSLSSEMSEAPSMHVEMGQEAVPVTIHPLSPEGNRSFNLETGTRSFAMTTGTRSRMATAAVATNDESSPINANVWADSPNHPIAQHGSRLSTQDLDRLRNLISEFCLKSLLPYVEKQIGLLSDVISNKKGVSRSLFSATKRWFGTSKPGVPGSAPTNAVIYTAESPELQLRRLGDLCFMFGHYTLAYQAYHSAKRDFAADQAWLYYAGALEMAALSAFMQGEMTRKTIEYMDDAILTYSNSCKMPQFATRATLLSAECLKGRNLHGEAAKQLIRMTSEDSDLRSALLLEQAAYCFVYPRMIHKYAFHAVLAGHRFSKSGQRRHSLRCYQQAYQVYRDRGWSSAEDHIHFTIGRQAASLKQVGDAVRAFEKLLNESSRQPGPQQAAFLREFLHTHHLLREESTTDRSEIPVLPLPLVDGNEIRVLLGSLPGSSTNDRVPASNVSFESSNDEDDSRWSKLEEAMVIEAQGTASMIFKPTIVLYTNRTNNGARPIGIVDEPINVSIELYNPMKISIPLTRVRLLWCFTRGDETISNETTRDEESRQPVETEILDSVTLQPNSRRRIVLTCTPRRTGDLKILGMSYDLSNSPTSDQPIVNPTVAVTGKRLFVIKGPRLKNVKEKPGASMYGTDYRLDVNVVDRSPLMRVTFGKISQEMLCGELQRLEVTLENVGQAPLKNIHVGSTNPRLFCLENNEEKCDAAVTKINLPGESLSPGDRHIVPLWIRAPHTKGNHRLDLLFYWENSDAKSIPKYRLCRHTWQLSVSDSIRISAIARRSAVRKSNLPSLTLTVRVKNMNQSHDPFMNEISLERVSLESKAWSLLESVVEPANLKIQPQETYGLLLKLVRKMEGESRFTDLSLTKERQDFDKTVTTFPFINFIQKRSTRLQNATEKFVDTQQASASDIDSLAITTRLDATLILRWRAKVTESGTSARHSIGQHHLDLDVINKTYKHPEERRNDQNDYTTRLKIFGPERNVADSTCIVKIRDDIDESECLKNILSFSMSHVREGKHNFDRSRMCVVPVHLHLQNHSQSRIDVKIDTIGTSSQTALPSIKTQLYSPQASTFFRYVGHTAATCHVDPLGVETIKLQAVISSPGTYDVSSRLEISARIANTGDYVLQKWRMESVCSIGHSCV